jgi:hypothetical protein
MPWLRGSWSNDDKVMYSTRTLKVEVRLATQRFRNIHCQLPITPPCQAPHPNRTHAHERKLLTPSTDHLYPSSYQIQQPATMVRRGNQNQFSQLILLLSRLKLRYRNVRASMTLSRDLYGWSRGMIWIFCSEGDSLERVH